MAIILWSSHHSVFCFFFFIFFFFSFFHISSWTDSKTKWPVWRLQMRTFRKRMKTWSANWKMCVFGNSYSLPQFSIMAYFTQKQENNWHAYIPVTLSVLLHLVTNLIRFKCMTESLLFLGQGATSHHGGEVQKWIECQH